MSKNTQILNGPGKSDLMLSLFDGKVIDFNFSFTPPNGWVTETYILSLKATKKRMLQDLEQNKNISISTLASEMNYSIDAILSSTSKKEDKEKLIESIQDLYNTHKRNEVLSTWNQSSEDIRKAYDSEIDRANGKQKFIVTSLELEDGSRNSWLFKAYSVGNNQRISGYYNSNRRKGSMKYVSKKFQINKAS